MRKTEVFYKTDLLSFDLKRDGSEITNFCLKTNIENQQNEHIFSKNSLEILLNALKKIITYQTPISFRKEMMIVDEKRAVKYTIKNYSTFVELKKELENVEKLLGAVNFTYQKEKKIEELIQYVSQISGHDCEAGPYGAFYFKIDKEFAHKNMSPVFFEMFKNKINQNEEFYEIIEEDNKILYEEERDPIAFIVELELSKYWDYVLPLCPITKKKRLESPLEETKNHYKKIFLNPRNLFHNKKFNNEIEETIVNYSKKIGADYILKKIDEAFYDEKFVISKEKREEMERKKEYNEILAKSLQNLKKYTSKNFLTHKKPFDQEIKNKILSGLEEHYDVELISDENELLLTRIKEEIEQIQC